MFRWFGLIWLRTKTVAVVEREYGRKLHVAGGPDGQLFNRMTRMARDFGGNENDAAAVFMVADAAARLRLDGEEDVGLDRQLQITAAQMPGMRRPDVVEAAVERVLATVDA